MQMQTAVFLLHLINELLWWQTCNSVFQLHTLPIKEIKKSTKRKCSNKTSTRSSWIHMWERKRAENSPVRRPAELQRASCWVYSPLFLLLCWQQKRPLLQVRRRRAKKNVTPTPTQNTSTAPDVSTVKSINSSLNFWPQWGALWGCRGRDFTSIFNADGKVI